MTKRTLEQQTLLQTTFDKVWNHLNKQGHAATSKNGHCVYLASNGDMCAVGCLLDHSKSVGRIECATIGNIHEDISSMSRSAINLKAVIIASGYDVENWELMLLLRKMQDRHDNYLTGSASQSELLTNWQEAMKSVANYFKLTHPLAESGCDEMIEACGYVDDSYIVKEKNG